MPRLREVVTVTVNGQAHSRDVECRRLLSDFLRHDLGLTGTHVGCEQGACGSCTIVIDGESVRSCLLLAVQADGCEITTVEALGTAGAMNALQEALWQHHGLQCGFCTPGILMAMEAARASGESLEHVETEVLSGHVCRCTGYAGIRAAVRAVWSKGDHAD